MSTARASDSRQPSLCNVLHRAIVGQALCPATCPSRRKFCHGVLCRQLQRCALGALPHCHAMTTSSTSSTGTSSSAKIWCQVVQCLRVWPWWGATRAKGVAGGFVQSHPQSDIISVRALVQQPGRVVVTVRIFLHGNGTELCNVKPPSCLCLLESSQHAFCGSSMCRGFVLI